jgi:PAS domain-containing protein
LDTRRAGERPLDRRGRRRARKIETDSDFDAVQKIGLDAGPVDRNSGLIDEAWQAVSSTDSKIGDPSAYASPVDKRRPKHLVLILAREFASNLATPTLIADDRGSLIFYNEAAEAVIGRTFAEAGEMPLDEWTATFAPRTLDSEPLPLERRPAGIALHQRRPAHERFRITSLDGVEREVAVTAFPLFAHADEFVGIVAIFWRE